jgi:hypothetical protein
MNAMRLKRILAALIVLSGLLSPHLEPAYAAESYNFSPVSQYGISLTTEYWNPIIGYVSTMSGVQ